MPIGIAGGGFDGDLTSDSTRTAGYVLSTDIAPTILRRFGLPIPDAMNGEPIRIGGAARFRRRRGSGDARLQAIPDRRAPVVILRLVAWIVVAALVGLFAPAIRGAAQPPGWRSPSPTCR